jgi:pimeloyl-ACP methyl ester carboxylesterase
MSLLLISLVLLILVFVGHSLVRLGLFREVACSGLSEMPEMIADVPGPEDMALDSYSGHMYISSDDRCGGQAGGSLWSIDLRDSLPVARPLSGTLPADFHPHGISLYRAAKDQAALFVVNHRTSGEQTIEIFDLPAPDTLHHRRTVRHPLLVWPNNLSATGLSQFYVTNVSRYGRIDAFLGLRGGYIAYFDGNEMREVAGGLAYPNGITQLPGDSVMVVSETIGGALQFYRREPGNGLTPFRKAFIAYGLDNINADSEGQLWVAAHPNMLRLNNHIRSGAASPSQVFRVAPKRETIVAERIFCDDGRQFPGISNALPYGDYLYLGAVCGPGVFKYPLLPRKEIDFMNIHEWKEKGHFRQIGDQRLFYAGEGEGEALLLLHAFPTASWGWHRLWPELTAHFQLIAPDFFGSGFSGKPKGRQYYAISFLADQAEELLEELGIEHVHLLANAYGVSIAQELLARQVNREALPFHIQSACFIGGGLFPEAARTTPMQRFLLTPAGRITARLFPTPYAAFRRNFSRTFGADHPPSEWLIGQVWQMLQYEEGLRRVPSTLRYLDDRRRRRDRLVGALEKAEIPLALINSKTDPLTGRTISEAWRKNLPAAPLYELEGDIGHYPPLEVPGQVLNHYLTFLEEKVRRHH